MSTTLGQNSYAVIDDFLPIELAHSMRQDIENHFATPEAHRGETHQIWNYWFIPELYTYLRTTPEKVIAAGPLEQFLARLKAWSINYCGMAQVTRPYLSLYVPGCQQGLHNDSGNGRFAFVYSLTLNERRTTGGETIVLRAGDHFRENLERPGAGRGFYDLIEPRFNRLAIFDDRMLHGVTRLEGSMDPAQVRFVLHGHLSETAAIVSSRDTAALMPQFHQQLQAAVTLVPELAGYHGPLVLRIVINGAGQVQSCDVVTDRVTHPDPRNTAWAPWLAGLISRIRAFHLTPTGDVSEVVQPLMFGKPLKR
jgi:Rps23 Pro-64 3,4-dihydroxylase Tpa1-like proline 4-hydroxylase